MHMLHEQIGDGFSIHQVKRERNCQIQVQRDRVLIVQNNE